MSKISVQVRVSFREAVLIACALEEYGAGEEGIDPEILEILEKIDRAGGRAHIKEKARDQRIKENKKC